MESFRRVGATVAVVIVASLIGASTAVAQSGGGGGGGGSGVQRAEGFITKKVMQANVHRSVPTVFPNARFEQFDRQDDLVVGCFNTKIDKYYGGGPMQACYYIMYLTEENRSNPDQWTLRDCFTPDSEEGLSLKKSSLLYVQRSKHSRKMRIRGNFRMTCPIDEQTIEWWNEDGPDYYPEVTAADATPFEHVESDNSFIDTTRDDLVRGPSGPADPPPGPLPNSGPPDLGKSAHGKSAREYWYETGCNYPGYYMQFSTGVWQVYSCFWAEQGVPGEHLSVFARAQWYASYYWTGRAWRLFQNGYGNGPKYARPVTDQTVR